jgi:8-oxo-dGTP pyrophosphatase MutT (NUDIX family)
VGLGSRVVYRNQWLTIREDRVIRPDGTRGIYSVVDTKTSVYIVALTPDDEVYLVRQYRYPTRAWFWELPAGNAAGENPLAAAKRELQEETGLVARRWTSIGRFAAFNGVANEWCYIFVARDLRETANHQKKEEGISHVRKVSLRTALRMIVNGTFADGQSIAALMRAALHCGILR